MLGASPARAADPAPVTYQGPSFGTAADRPTQDKPQSKLWFNDGSWWALLLNPATNRIDVAELRPDHQWHDTGVVVDDRPTSTGDALWARGFLWVASRVQSGAIRVNRFTYDGAARTYVRSAGFPVTIASGGSESVTIDQDSTGRLWATYTRGSRVWVTHTTTSPTAWAAPFNPPVPDTSISADDLSGVIAFSGRIGVLWSDQASDAFRMAVHRDADPVNQWTVEDALAGNNMADDHLNLKTLAGDDLGRLFAVVKTSQGDSGEPATSPLIVLLVRATNGTWSSSVVATRGDNWTRPQLVIDRTNRRLYVLATTPEGGGVIRYKTAPLDSPSFPAGAGAPFLSWPGARVNNITTAKDPVDATTGLVALASEEFQRRYYHAELALGTPAPTDTTPPSTPSGVRATTVSSSRIDLAWNASSDNVGVTGYSVSRDGVRVATLSATSWSDTGLAAGTTHTYTVDAIDAAGNRSAPSAAVTATTSTTPSSGITRRAASFAANPTATTLTIPTPTGTQPGDVLLATIDVRGRPTMTAPAGWQLLRTDVNGTVMTKATWWRVATASEPATHTFQLSSAQAAAGAIAAYAGVDTANPIAAHAGQVNASSTAITAPSVTTTMAGAYLLGLFGTGADATITAPAGMNALGQAVSNAGTYKVSSNVDDQLLTSATTTGARQATASRAAANIGQLIALRPS